ncbi:UNVERIFIED_CONTAM: putative GTP diphosphokinase RSH2, chloroplastic [Sesamum calycinum]|uniref:GTP diphosphokinase n=1 Tax=Sesamum calycinum TaxID=2727403 RepID=A0AAW2LV58_9LAMI
MSSCHSSSTTTTMFITPKTSLILRQNTFFFPNSTKFRCVFHQIVPKFVVSSSLSSLLTSGNVIAAAAAAGSGSVHGAVSSAITQVAVTAVAIASGACLSTKVDFLWPKLEEQPGSLVLDGVDVTGYTIFNDEKVQKAIAFARKAHHGQTRMTGDPYLSHCIHTGKILAVLVPSNGKRAIDTVVAGILHDVVDDTCESLHSIEREFGAEVAKLVGGVSRLSYINQLLRRHRRMNLSQATLSHEEANNLRVMLLGMIDDPRVVLIKLADRLHNMRTIYALPSTKAQAVAQETLVIWCSLASRLGLWALKAELEDLCFAVLQPKIFRQMRAELASMWSPIHKTFNIRKSSVKSSNVVQFHECEEPTECDEENTSMKILLQAVLPFDLLLDRKKRVIFYKNLTTFLDTPKQPKVVRDAGIALASLVVCEEALERELFISTSYIPGMEVTLSGRLKSLYSIYSKMKRKDVGIDKVYDARALRVIVGDKNGTLHGQAVQCCYNLLNIIHRFWTPIDGEFDDYIVNPKPSGYQVKISIFIPSHCSTRSRQLPFGSSNKNTGCMNMLNMGLLHTGFIRNLNLLPSKSSVTASEVKDSADFSKDMEDQDLTEDDAFIKYSSLKVGHPVLRVEAGHLLAAVIVRVDNGGSELLVAVSFGLAASEAVAERRSSYQIKRWEAYANLYKKVSDEWWCEPGHGDWCTCLEKYILCRDGIYHKQDQFQRLLPTFIQVIELTEREETEYWAVVSAVFEGKSIASDVSSSSCEEKPSLAFNSALVDNGINNKVLLLRTMLQWEEQLRSEAGFRQLEVKTRNYRHTDSFSLGEVAIVCWPNGEIMRLRTGSTAADAARRIGFDGKLVSVNGQLVVPNTQLKDGDVVEVRM